MMTVSHLLEDFGSAAHMAGPHGSTVPEYDAVSGLEMFEKGYKDGWDDAMKAQEQSRAHIADDLGRNLQDLAFTYHEAHGHMVRALAPMFESMLTAFLPTLARAALLPRLVEELTAMGAAQSEIPVEVCVHPEAANRVHDLLEGLETMPMRIVADPDLGPHQASLQFGDEERLVDFDTMLDRVGNNVRAFFDQNRKDMSHE